MAGAGGTVARSAWQADVGGADTGARHAWGGRQEGTGRVGRRQNASLGASGVRSRRAALVALVEAKVEASTRDGVAHLLEGSDRAGAPTICGNRRGSPTSSHFGWETTSRRGRRQIAQGCAGEAGLAGRLGLPTTCDFNLPRHVRSDALARQDHLIAHAQRLRNQPSTSTLDQRLARAASTPSTFTREMALVEVTARRVAAASVRRTRLGRRSSTIGLSMTPLEKSFAQLGSSMRTLEHQLREAEFNEFTAPLATISTLPELRGAVPEHFSRMLAESRMLLKAPTS